VIPPLLQMLKQSNEFRKQKTPDSVNPGFLFLKA